MTNRRPNSAAPTPEERQAAVDMCADRPALLDQQGRWWSRWWAATPAAAVTCAKCGKRIDHGYLLLPYGTVKICATHVEHKWV